ncbi:MAG: ATP-binding protein [Sedimentibacter saalensis]|uniref:ATP-binding protein n=1 Tax=Sedimentibacter saalensis TaxID=130788 RepID=UPI002B2010E6|nr:ATP-binding protein [Sedimentibacter saalensis]MEA5096478.1 ATP-binding protein [Sedimentibacter saalensis]
MSNIIDVKITQEHIDRNAKTSPKEAIKELLWNSCDADATYVDVSFEFNYFGDEVKEIETIVVKDNGHGIKFEELDSLFGLYGRSNKTYTEKSPKGRMYHGKLGQGRYKSFSMGTSIKWESTYIAEDEKKYRFFIYFDTKNKMKCTYSEKELMSDNAETGVIVTISGIIQSVNILADNQTMIEEVIYSFAPYLLAYKDINIVYNGIKVNPKSYIDDHVQIAIDSEYNGSNAQAVTIIIRWKDCIKHFQKMYLCGEGGATYTNVPINTKGHSISVYLLSSLFDEMSKNNTLEFGESNTLYSLLVAQAKKELINYINSHFHTEAVEEVKKIKETDLYPYSGEPISKIDDAERQYFDLVAVEINNAIPSFRNSSPETKKLTYRLIREAVKTNPDSLTTILTEIFRLSSEQQDEFARLLDYTTLPAVINMTQTISNRLLFINALEQMIYNREVGKSIKERTQFHKILLGELWIFGEKYSLGTSDVSLKNVLKTYLKHLEREELTPEIPYESANDVTLIPDLCLWRQYPIQEERIENLIIEIKRPTKILGQNELAQIKKYAYAIADDPLFPKENTKWNFLLLGMDFDKYVTRELQDKKTGEGNYYNSEDGHISISVFRWNKIIQDNKLRFDFLKNKLEYTLNESEQALQYLHNKYAELFAK